MEPQLITVWRLIPHHEDKEAALAWTKTNEHIAVGWGFVGDVEAINYQTAKDIQSVIDRAYSRGTHPSNNGDYGGQSLWNLVHRVKVGDYVIISGIKARQLVVKVVGEYSWLSQTDQLLKSYPHQREVEITNISPTKLWDLAGSKIIGTNYVTLAPCANQVDPEDLNL